MRGGWALSFRLGNLGAEERQEKINLESHVGSSVILFQGPAVRQREPGDRRLGRGGMGVSKETVCLMEISGGEKKAREGPKVVAKMCI